ncbi:MAG TPA: trigger factor [Firmicutes bacterium]|nr:trigger factor [Bacillota bacterium]
MFKVEKIDNNIVTMEIEVPKEKVNEALEDAYKKVVKTVSVPGFRKGKAPRRILEVRFGPEIFYNDALEILVDPAYNEAVKESQIEPINQPEMELIQIKKDEPLIFKVNVEVKPEVELCEYKGITVQQVKKQVASEDVDNYLNYLREQHARLVSIEEGELQVKDMTMIDFVGSIDGEPFEGGAGENYSLEIGSGSFVQGFEEQLIGARVGEERDVHVTFPADYTKAELAGKDADFHVTVKEIKRPQLPELDDAFVQELSEDFSTMEEFREDAREKLEESLKSSQKAELENKIIEKVAAQSRVEVPEILVEREINGMLAQFEYYLNMQGLTLQQFAEMSEGGLERIREDRREEAEKKARINLVLGEIIKKEAFEVTDDEVEAKIKEMAGEMDIDVAREQFAESGRLEMLQQEIRYRKAIDLLVKEAVIEEIEEEIVKETTEKKEENEGKETAQANKSAEPEGEKAPKNE